MRLEITANRKLIFERKETSLQETKDTTEEIWRAIDGFETPHGPRRCGQATQAKRMNVSREGERRKPAS